ncbi:ATP-binding protein [Kineococcus rhizosphaerae]|uniref:AAA ATPase-like protein n=1 Tax=Kineococcus rhizosphaerae TaxID=559628 RepID=A0A2T0QTJ5_9ACTN|nr:ATP-binding protein [Kineococcus rhizosphaerae]PRY08313.1 AAA ATPase-like protein [Kineococcus rhizosphaerae]
MDAVSNPYSPGAGRPPVALVGRDAQRRAWQVALERIERDRGAQPVVLYGLRGVGKTVLLNEFAKVGRGREWLVAAVEAGVGKSLRELLGEALHGPLSDLVRPSAGRRLLKALKTATSFKASYDSSGTWSFGLDLSESSGGGADTGVLETDLGKLLKDVADAAAEDGSGLAVLIDEAQDLSTEELTALCSIVHAAGQQGWHLTVALAGLPSLPRELAEAGQVH